MTTHGTPVTTGGNQGQDVKGAVAAESGQVAQTAKDQAQNVAGEAAGQVQNVAAEAKSQARDLAGELKTQVQDQSNTQRDRLVGTLRQIGDELREMADGGSQSGVASELARQASTRVQDLGGYLEGRQPGDLLEDLRNFARRRPGTFLLGAAAAGAVAGRMTRGAKAAASSDSSASGFADTGTYSTGYSGGGYTGTGYTGAGYAETGYATTPATGPAYSTPAVSGAGGTAAADPLTGVESTDPYSTNVDPAYGLGGDSGTGRTDDEWTVREGRGTS